MSKVIAVNAGSSSLKFKIYEVPSEDVVASGQIDRIGIGNSNISIKYGEGQKFEDVKDIADHEVATEFLLNQLNTLNIITSYDEISGTGHRVVAGGEIFKESTLLDDEAIQKIDELAEFAPLHNGPEARAIRAFQKVLPGKPAVGIFDTSFHTTMPEVAYLYSIPLEYYEEFGARRYGAHGTSHRYVANRAAELMGKPIEDLKIITCHLGNGGSITAVDGGKSIDTSMGFTPLAGITMGTRSGDIDASLVQFLMKKLNITDIDEMISILNNKSGLLGLSGVSSDMRDVEDVADNGDERSQTTLEIFYDRVRKYIGQYIAVMGGVDAVVFTAGIGENSGRTRAAIIDDHMAFFGMEIDETANDTRDEAKISSEDSKVAIYTIPTDEELVIVRDTVRLGNINE